MARVSVWAGLGKTQAELDFVDVDPLMDTRLFVDPYAIEIKRDAWSNECGHHLRSYFNALIQALRGGNRARAEHLAGHLSEPRETYLGLSKHNPQGRGMGREQSGQLLDALANSQAVQSGLLSELGEAELFIEGIGRDKISDLTTNIIRGPLLSYTREQAEAWGMPLTRRGGIGPVWDPVREDWIQDYQDVLVVNGSPVILVPKYSVRLGLTLNSQEFYNHYIEFLQAEYFDGGRGLARVLASGERRPPTKKTVKERHPKYKPDLAEFAQQHPDILEQYKRIKGARGAPENEDIDPDFDERQYARELIVELDGIPLGNDTASDYHKYCLGALTFLFYPDLIKPKKEREIDEGRKRIDISFTNAAQAGFFDTALRSNQMRCLELPVECKNYTKDVQNPELDQLEGRFSHARGFLGLLLCRQIVNKDRFIARCRDSVLNRGHYVLPIDDVDMRAMLTMVAEGRRGAIDGFLRQRLALISG